jgi:ATP-binding cassette subfamily C (CFTR/MRP) protein 1
MMVPAAFLLVFGVARLWFLSKRSSLPLDMTSNWLYFAKMVCAKKINNKKMLYI